jgi:HPt (histidine-containing phosphotransfer) domain-containing protein
MSIKQELDLSYLKEITGDEPALMKEFVEMFLNQLKESKVLFIEAFQLKDATQIQQLAHKMKSSFGVLGVDTRLLAELEKEIKEGKVFEDVQDQAKELIQDLDVVFEMVDTLCKKLA